MTITPLMRQILEVMSGQGPMTPNHIGGKLNLPRVTGSGSGRGRGSGYRVFGAAQRIIIPLTRLRELGLVSLTTRPDGMSGTAYIITDTGEEVLK